MVSKRFKKLFIGLAMVFGLIAGWFAFNYRIHSVSVNGNSMAPSFVDGDRLLLLDNKSLDRNELVLFNSPPDWFSLYNGFAPEVLIKRVKGVPGDLLEWDGRQFTINDQLIHRSGAGERCSPGVTSQVIPKNHVFVTGDANGSKTIDSLHAFCHGVEQFFVPTSYITVKGVLIRKL